MLPCECVFSRFREKKKNGSAVVVATDYGDYYGSADVEIHPRGAIPATVYFSLSLFLENSHVSPKGKLTNRENDHDDYYDMLLYATFTLHSHSFAVQ